MCAFGLAMRNAVNIAYELCAANTSLSHPCAWRSASSEKAHASPNVSRSRADNSIESIEDPIDVVMKLIRTAVRWSVWRVTFHWISCIAAPFVCTRDDEERRIFTWPDIFSTTGSQLSRIFGERESVCVSPIESAWCVMSAPPEGWVLARVAQIRILRDAFGEIYSITQHKLNDDSQTTVTVLMMLMMLQYRVQLMQLIMFGERACRGYIVCFVHLMHGSWHVCECCNFDYWCVRLVHENERKCGDVWWLERREVMWRVGFGLWHRWHPHSCFQDADIPCCCCSVTLKLCLQVLYLYWNKVFKLVAINICYIYIPSRKYRKTVI